MARAREYSWEQSVRRIREVYGEVMADGLSRHDGYARRAPRVALVHDWLTGMRGGEKVLEAARARCTRRRPLHAGARARHACRRPSSGVAARLAVRPPLPLAPAASTGTCCRCSRSPSSSSTSTASTWSSAPATARRSRSSAPGGRGTSATATPRCATCGTSVDAYFGPERIGAAPARRRCGRSWPGWPGGTRRRRTAWTAIWRIHNTLRAGSGDTIIAGRPSSIRRSTPTSTARTARRRRRSPWSCRPWCRTSGSIWPSRRAGWPACRCGSWVRARSESRLRAAGRVRTWSSSGRCSDEEIRELLPAGRRRAAARRGGLRHRPGGGPGLRAAGGRARPRRRARNGRGRRHRGAGADRTTPPRWRPAIRRGAAHGVRLRPRSARHAERFGRGAFRARGSGRVRRRDAGAPRRATASMVKRYNRLLVGLLRRRPTPCSRRLAFLLAYVLRFESGLIPVTKGYPPVRASTSTCCRSWRVPGRRSPSTSRASTACGAAARASTISSPCSSAASSPSCSACGHTLYFQAYYVERRAEGARARSRCRSSSGRMFLVAQRRAHLRLARARPAGARAALAGRHRPQAGADCRRRRPGPARRRPDPRAPRARVTRSSASSTTARAATTSATAGCRSLGTLEEAGEIVQRERIDQLYVALPLDEHVKMLRARRERQPRGAWTSRSCRTCCSSSRCARGSRTSTASRSSTSTTCRCRGSTAP